MPNYYAHLSLGAQVLSQLPQELSLLLNRERSQDMPPVFCVIWPWTVPVTAGSTAGRPKGPSLTWPWKPSSTAC